MKLSELQSKKIIDTSDGKSIGAIIDCEITKDGKIESLIIENGKSIFNLNKDFDTTIEWNEITKIGEDVILIKKAG